MESHRDLTEERPDIASPRRAESKHLRPAASRPEPSSRLFYCRRATRSLATLLMILAFALPALAQPADETAKRFHVFPRLADGGGFQSVLLVTNVASSENRCTLQLHGQLTTDRFRADTAIGPHSLDLASDSTATIRLSSDTAPFVWPTRDEATLATGYATLDCTAAVVAQVLYVLRNSSGATAGTATVFSSQPASAFQFPVLGEETPLAFAIANDTDEDASCRLVLDGLSSDAFSVPSKSHVAQFLSEAIDVPAGFTTGLATVSCDRQVSVIGLQFDGTIFTTLPPAILPSTPAPPQFDGLRGDSLIVTRRTAPPDSAWRTLLADEGEPFADCTGLLDCDFDPFWVTADLAQSGLTVTGSMRVRRGELDDPAEWGWGWAVNGVVSSDGTLGLTAREASSFLIDGVPVEARLVSWESRSVTPDYMTGTITFHLSSDEIPGTVVFEGCMGVQTLRRANKRVSSDRILYPPCIGWAHDREKAQYIDERAKRFHVFPRLADGGGFQSVVLVHQPGGLG